MSRINADDIVTAKAFTCSSSNVRDVRTSDPLLLDAIRNLGPARVYFNSRNFEFRLIDGDGSAEAIKLEWQATRNARKQSDAGSPEPCPTEQPEPRSPASA